MRTLTKQLDEFAPYWGSEARNYVLIRLNPESAELRDCIIFDHQSKSAEIIEDDELALEVKRRMVEAGVKIVNAPLGTEA